MIMTKRHHPTVRLAVPVLFLSILLLLWQWAVAEWAIPRWILPTPLAIFRVMWEQLHVFWPHIRVSLLTILLGFGIAVPLGIALAALLTSFKWLDRALSPYLILLVTTPLITLLPLLMYWLGYGMGVRVIAVVVQSFPIVNMNACTGFDNVARLRLELMESMQAGRLETFRRVILPSSVVEVFTGIRLAAIFATTACISAEYVGGNNGLGSQIIKYSQFIKTEHAFACIFFVASIGVFLYGSVVLLERCLMRHRT